MSTCKRLSKNPLPVIFYDSFSTGEGEAAGCHNLSSFCQNCSLSNGRCRVGQGGTLVPFVSKVFAPIYY
jgi:hypothetical protein